MSAFHPLRTLRANSYYLPNERRAAQGRKNRRLFLGKRPLPVGVDSFAIPHVRFFEIWNDSERLHRGGRICTKVRKNLWMVYRFGDSSALGVTVARLGAVEI